MEKSIINCENSSISLLWLPGGHPDEDSRMLMETDSAVQDLSLHEISRFLSAKSPFGSFLSNMLSKLTTDTATIAYRLDILEDLLSNPDICRCMEDILPYLYALAAFDRYLTKDEEVIKHINRVNELEVYLKCIDSLSACLSPISEKLKSEGMRSLYKMIEAVYQSQDFQSLKEELPKIRARFSRIESVTIGVNLDDQLRPVDATLVSINDKRYLPGDILDKILSLNFLKDSFRGISPLQVVVRGTGTEVQQQNFILEQAILNSLSNILRGTIRHITPAISKYVQINAAFLVNLRTDFIFYLNAINLIQQLKSAGLPMCKPESLPMEERSCTIKGLYNINLAISKISAKPNGKLDTHIVKNDIEFGPNGRIFILTGPNQGGKTTFTVAVGLAQILFQLGLYVPARSARMSPVDSIYTHFPVEEKPDTNLGRMGEECERLGAILDKASRFSLVLLNEPLSSTSPGEGLYIARETVLAFKLLECRAIVATHFHELGENLDAVNASVPGDSKIESLVAGVYTGLENSSGFSRRSYIITVGPPQGYSYAKDIAMKHGISLQKIKERLGIE